MQTKLFEIRDRATFIPILAIRLSCSLEHREEETYLLASAGYGSTQKEQAQYVLLAEIAGGVGEVACDPHKWSDRRTLLVAHDYIQQHFDELKSGDVIDVQYILEETTNPKVSERLTNPY